MTYFLPLKYYLYSSYLLHSEFHYWRKFHSFWPQNEQISLSYLINKLLLYFHFLIKTFWNSTQELIYILAAQ